MDKETKNYARSTRGFQKIDRTLFAQTKQKSFSKALNKHQVLKYWTEIAAAFLSGAADLSQAIDFNNGLLTVACLSKELVSQIYLFKEQLIAAINDVLGQRLVFAIHVEY